MPDDALPGATRFLIVATKTRDRWFDLDAVREAPKQGTAGQTLASTRAGTGYRSDPTTRIGMGGREDQPHLNSSPAGAPPLDYWKLNDTDDTFTPEEPIVSHARYLIGDARARLAELPDNSVDLVLSSPPFLALRSYLPSDDPNKPLEIGSESTPGEFLDVLLDVVEACDRVLAPHGSLVFELGDTYSGNGGVPSDAGKTYHNRNREIFDGDQYVIRTRGDRHPGGVGWPLDKSLCMIPQSFAWALAYGRNPFTGRETPRWRVRNVIAWCRPNPPVGCVDTETEALTPDGWKREHELVDGDLIAAYDPATDSCQFLPASFVRWQRDGDMVAIDKRSTSQRLTPDHRCWTRTRKRPPHVQLAGELTNTCDTLLCAPIDDVPGPAPVSVARAELLGWFIAEGSVHHRQARIVQSVTVNPDKVERIQALLDADGADYHFRTYRAAYNGSTMGVFNVKGELAEWLNLHPKRLPMNYVTTWPEAQARALFNGLIDGDGHRRKTGRGHGIMFHQKDEHVADAVQVLAIRLGHRATKSYQPSLGAWQITIGRNRWTRIRKWDGEGIRSEPYSGTVWCPQIETTFWLARRDGKTFVTGNSLGDKVRPATSYLTVATHTRDRWFDLDAVREPLKHPGKGATTGARSGEGDHRALQPYDGTEATTAGAPPLDWWEIPTEPYPGSHYATWPRDLCVKPIRMMCPERVCTALVCNHCGHAHPVIRDHHIGELAMGREAVSLPETVQAELRHLRDLLRGSEPVRVLAEVPVRAAEAGAVPPAELQGRADQSPGLHPDLQAGQPDGDGEGLRARTSARDVGVAGSAVASVGARASSQRATGRQPARESGDRVPADPSWRDHVSRLRIHLLDSLTCPLHSDNQRGFRVCGEPSRRIVGEAEYINPKTGKAATTLHFDGVRQTVGENHWDTAGLGDRAAVRVAPTLGWSDCGCSADGSHWRRGVVLDPFAGSGTTGAVATGLGRDAVLIDIDRRNAELARDRCGMFLTIEETAPSGGE